MEIPLSGVFCQVANNHPITKTLKQQFCTIRVLFFLEVFLKNRNIFYNEALSVR